MATEEEVKQIKRRHAPRLLSLPGVSGVGVEKDEKGDYVISIHLATDDPAVLHEMPDQIEGLAVRLIKSGPYKKFDERP